MRNRRHSTWISFPWLSIVFISALAAGAWSAAAEIPEALEDIVFGDEKRTVVATNLNGVPFDALTVFSEFPYLMWPADEKDAAVFPDDPAAGAEWLGRCAATLGVEHFEVKFMGRSSWRTSEVWVYVLLRHGLPVHDARIEVHWQKKTFLGIVNHIPGRIVAIGDLPMIRPNEEWVYYPVREGVGMHRLVPAKVERVDRDDRIEVTIVGPDGTLNQSIQTKVEPQDTGPRRFYFEEYRLPAGTFPDQISFDEEGIIWLSQPNNNLITSFNPVTEEFTQYPTTGGSGPDGLIVGTQGRVWSGMYYSGSLGLFDSNTETFHNYPAPYANANMAIPVETTDGNVWVTDHARNRISEFDPVTETWLQSIVMPTGACWVVQGYEDRDHGFIYFTEYNANQLGRIAVGGNSVTDIPTPGGGPAFCVYSDGKVFYSRWLESGIGAYDVNSRIIVEYDFPIQNEPGGPLWLAPDGKIVTGSRNRGYIMVFNPATERFAAYLIPTSFPGLKDGLTVDAHGVIWFTESGANKLARLRVFP